MRANRHGNHESGQNQLSTRELRAARHILEHARTIEVACKKLSELLGRAVDPTSLRDAFAAARQRGEVEHDPSWYIGAALPMPVEEVAARCEPLDLHDLIDARRISATMRGGKRSGAAA